MLAKKKRRKGERKVQEVQLGLRLREGEKPSLDSTFS